MDSFTFYAIYRNTYQLPSDIGWCTVIEKQLQTHGTRSRLTKGHGKLYIETFTHYLVQNEMEVNSLQRYYKLGNEFANH